MVRARPRRPPTDSGLPPPVVYTGRAMRSILVVEADPGMRRAVAEALAPLFTDARVLLADAGETALEIARRTRPGLILLDLGLRGMDGLELARRLRALPAGASVPIVALTADMRPDTLLRAEAAGFVAFLRMPADPDRLDAVLRLLLERVSPSS